MEGGSPLVMTWPPPVVPSTAASSVGWIPPVWSSVLCCRCSVFWLLSVHVLVGFVFLVASIGKIVFELLSVFDSVASSVLGV